MNDSEVVDIFESVLKSEGHGYGGVIDLLRMIDSIENALEGRYWRIKNVVGIFNRLYEKDDKNWPLLRPRKKELQALYERENA